MISRCKKFKTVEDKVQMLLLSIFLAIMVTSIIMFFLTSVMLEKRYQSAVELINDQKWYQAEQVLKLVSIYKYKDAEIIRSYAWANIKLDLIDKKDLRKHNYIQVIDCINKIPDDYQGIFKNEISKFRNNILQKSNTNKLMTENATTPADPQKSILTVGKCLYFGRLYTYPMFFGF